MNHPLAQFKCLMRMGLQVVREVREKCAAALAHLAGQVVRKCAGTLQGAALGAPTGRTWPGAGVEERKTRNEAPDLTSRSEYPHAQAPITVAISVHPLRGIEDRGHGRLHRRQPETHRVSPLPRVHEASRLATTVRPTPDSDSVDTRCHPRELRRVLPTKLHAVRNKSNETNRMIRIVNRIIRLVIQRADLESRQSLVASRMSSSGTRVSRPAGRITRHLTRVIADYRGANRPHHPAHGCAPSGVAPCGHPNDR